MSTLYSAVFSNVAVTAQQDLFAMVAPTSCLLVIRRVLITQTTEVGDAQEEGLSIQIRKNNTTVGSGGSAGTFNPLEVQGPAFPSGGSVRLNDTTKQTGGTAIVLHSEAWNVRGAFDYRPTPEELITLSPGIRCSIELATTPADSITMSGTIIVETLGG